MGVFKMNGGWDYLGLFTLEGTVTALKRAQKALMVSLAVWVACTAWLG